MDKDKVLEHLGHEIEIATYGNNEQVMNVAIECLECNEVIWDADLTN